MEKQTFQAKEVYQSRSFFPINVQKTIYLVDAATSGLSACIPLNTNRCIGEPEVYLLVNTTR